MVKLNAVGWVALILVVVGGLNWGLVGLLNFNLVAFIFGESPVAKLIYILVGLAAIYTIITALMACQSKEASSQQA